MAVKVRLTRVGKRNDPFYRVIAIDESRPREGQALETLGYWHPKANSKEIKKEAIEAWRLKGAIISQAVKNLLA